jgi:putative transposase
MAGYFLRSKPAARSAGGDAHENQAKRRRTASGRKQGRSKQGMAPGTFSMRSRKRGRAATGGQHEAGRRTALNDGSSARRQSIQEGTSSETPVCPDSITRNENVLRPFFDDRCKEASRILRSLASSDLHGPDSRESNCKWQKKELGPSSVRATNVGPPERNSTSISFQISRSAAKKFLATGNADELTRVRRVQLFPTREQEKVLNRWFGACRFTYNECVNLLNTVGSIPTKNDWFQWLRNRFVTNKNIQGRKTWLLDTPKHTREGAVKDFVAAYKAAITNRKRKNIERFRMGFRRKDDGQQSILVQRGATQLSIDDHGVHLYKRSLGGPLATRQPVNPRLDVSINHDCRLIKANGKFYLAMPVDVAKEEKATTISNFCAIDTGIRTFGATWSPEGVSEIGAGFATELYPRLVGLDKLRSKIDKEEDHRKRKRKKAAFGRLTERFQNRLKDFHYKTAHYLCSKYDNIIIPKFGSKRMSSRADRRLRTKTVRQMLCLGHAKFREILIQTADRMGKNVFVVTEEYTSKTCCNCSALHQKLGGNKRFKCPRSGCGFHADRDIHAAFNIFLKFLKETSASFSW